MKASIDLKGNLVSFTVNTEIYSKDVIYKACYVFIDKMYILLDVSNKKDLILVTLKGKTALSKKEIEKLEGEFMNELLNSLLRSKISKRNQKLLEHIVGGAMGAALGVNVVKESNKSEDANLEDTIRAKEIEDAVEALKIQLAEIESNGDYENDELGIRKIASVKKCKKVKLNKGRSK